VPRLLSKLTAALVYAMRVWPVLPLHAMREGRCTCGKPDCPSPGKHPFGPLMPHGLKEGSTDQARIRQWWTQQPDANVGIVTGAASGIFVFDVDPRHGGDEHLAELEREHHPLPRTTEAATGGGGRHLFFAHPGGRVPSRTIVPGVDVKGDGGYVVAPPSVTTASYSWLVSPDEIEPVEVVPL
jgi:Bifunctional DNA primase/polymerase, N-terminal